MSKVTLQHAWLPYQLEITDKVVYLHRVHAIFGTIRCTEYDSVDRMTKLLRNERRQMHFKEFRVV